MNITPLHKKTLTEQVIEQLANKIISDELKSGDKLPTERKLAELFGVTRNVVREAVRALSLIGMVTIRPSGGIFVNAGQKNIPSDTIIWMYKNELNNYEEIYDARKLIETEVYLTCFQNMTPKILEKINEYMNDIEKASESSLNVTSFLNLLTGLDLYVADNCGKRIYSKLMQTMIILRQDISFQILQKDKEAVKKAVKGRRKIVNALGTNDEKLVRKTLNDFFRDSINTLHLI